MNNHPQIINRRICVEEKSFKKLCSSGVTIIDTYRDQLKELYMTEHPHDIFSSILSRDIRTYIRNQERKSTLEMQGVWVYFPWSQSLVHLLKKEDFFRVRTSRNKHLITDEEQKKMYQTCIGIAGLSVGNSIAKALVLIGGVEHLKIADNDTLEVSNMNRIMTGVQHLGKKKVQLTAEHLYEMDPFMEIEIYQDGLHKNNVKDFMDDPTLDIMIDETDDMDVKYLLRKEAGKKNIPVISAADVGNVAVVDIDKGKPIFNGRLGVVTEKTFKNLSKIQTGEYITKLIGKENVSKELQFSLSEIGNTIVSWPQLGSTAMLNGVLVTRIVRDIISKKNVRKRITASL